MLVRTCAAGALRPLRGAHRATGQGDEENGTKENEQSQAPERAVMDPRRRLKPAEGRDCYEARTPDGRVLWRALEGVRAARYCPLPPPFPALSLCLFATRRLFKVLSRSFESPYAFGDWRGVAASIFSWDRAASVAAVWVRAHEASGRVG